MWGQKEEEKGEEERVDLLKSDLVAALSL